MQVQVGGIVVRIEKAVSSQKRDREPSYDIAAVSSNAWLAKVSALVNRAYSSNAAHG